MRIDYTPNRYLTTDGTNEPCTYLQRRLPRFLRRVRRLFRRLFRRPPACVGADSCSPCVGAGADACVPSPGAAGAGTGVGTGAGPGVGLNIFPILDPI